MEFFSNYLPNERELHPRQTQNLLLLIKLSSSINVTEVKITDDSLGYTS